MPTKQTKTERTTLKTVSSANTGIYSQRIFVPLCLSVLAASTALWTYLGARLQASNADQLVNTYLFENIKTFRESTLPAQHSFLIKWPLFLFVRLLGSGSGAFMFGTFVCTFVTIGLFVYLLWRINPKPWFFGSICLALASVLLLVPAQPYAGGILPVNMAMLATRNIEYIIFIICIALFMKAPRLRSKQFLSAVALSSVLIASDKLFALLLVGGAGLSLVAYSLAQGWNLVKTSVHWFVGSIASLAGGTLLLWGIDHSGLVHISHDSGGVAPALIHSAHDTIIAAIYSLGALATNLGANPAFDARTIPSAPRLVVDRLFSLGGPAFLINAVLFLAGILLVCHLLLKSFSHNRSNKLKLTEQAKLSLALIWVSLAGILGFVFTVHYHPVDARYLTIILFALFIAGATYARQYAWRPRRPYVISAVLVAGIVCAAVTSISVHNQQARVYTELDTRNEQITQALDQHKVDDVVGDYWRVIPMKRVLAPHQVVTPLASCAETRQVLSSKAWQPDLSRHSFAYLLTLDKNLTDFPNCSLDDVIGIHGRPSSSTLIAGSRDNPKELVLYYDSGTRKSAPQATLKTPSTVLPISLDELPSTSCSVPTVLNIVAHEDDDLLFMNPDIIHDIQAKHCVRTVYLTAGDAGQNKFYWVGRQRGAESAYSSMLGINNIWIERVVKLGDNAFVTVANPRGNANISLIFFNLPDGNIHGEGFRFSHNQSLVQLDNDAIPSMTSIDGQSTFTKSTLISSLTEVMSLYKPSEIRTQSSLAGDKFHDHSDHLTVSSLTKQAYTLFESNQYENHLVIPIKYYIGYPVHGMPPNVSGSDLQSKEKAFFSYGGFDSGVCNSSGRCLETSVYGTYLEHQYQNPY